MLTAKDIGCGDFRHAGDWQGTHSGFNGKDVLVTAQPAVADVRLNLTCISVRGWLICFEPCFWISSISLPRRQFACRILVTPWLGMMLLKVTAEDMVNGTL